MKNSAPTSPASALIRRYRPRALSPVSGASRHPSGEYGASAARATPPVSTMPASAPNAATRPSAAMPRSAGAKSRNARGTTPTSDGSMPRAMPTRIAAWMRCGNDGVPMSRSRTWRRSIQRRAGTTTTIVSARARAVSGCQSVQRVVPRAGNHWSIGASASRRTTPIACGPALLSTAHDSGEGPRSRSRRAERSRRVSAIRSITCRARVRISSACLRWPSRSMRRSSRTARSAATVADSGGSPSGGGGPRASRSCCMAAVSVAAAAAATAASR